MPDTPCQNPDESCAEIARYYWRGMKLCRKCCLRFKRTGEGKKHHPWGAKKRRKDG